MCSGGVVDILGKLNKFPNFQSFARYSKRISGSMSMLEYKVIWGFCSTILEVWDRATSNGIMVVLLPNRRTRKQGVDNECRSRNSLCLVIVGYPRRKST